MPRAAAQLLLALLCAAIAAAELYVSAEPGEEGSGKAARPFRNLERACAALQPGDTLNVLPGTYKLANSISFHGRGGKPGLPVTIRGPEKGPLPVIDASALPKGKQGSGAFYLGNCAFVNLRFLHVTGSPGHGITIWASTDIRIEDCEVSNCVVNGIYAGRGPGPLITGIYVARCHSHDNCTFNRVHNNRGDWGQGIGLSGCSGGVIEDCISERNFGEGLDVYNSVDCRMSRNISRDNFSVLIYLDNAQRCIVERNLAIITGAQDYYRDGQPAGGIVIADEPRAQPMPNIGTIIRNNIVVRSYNGFRYGSYGQGNGLNTLQFIGNTIVDPAEHSVQIDKGKAHVGSLFAGNVFVSDRNHVYAPGGLAGITFQRNAWYGGAGNAQRGQGDVNGDPRLVNRAGLAATDFAFLAGSPLLNAWPDATGLTDDYAGLARPQGGVCDIGAWEAPDAKTIAARRKEQSEAEAAAKPKRPVAATVQAAKPQAEALQRFTARTRERALAAAKAGRGPLFTLKAMRSEATIEGGDEGDVILRVGPSGMSVAWRTLTPEDYVGIALHLARSGDPGDCGLAAFWLRCVGRDPEARDHLARAGTAAAEVEAAFTQ